MSARQPESLFVRLAQSALELFVRSGRRLAVPDPLPEELSLPQACFVSLKTRGQLRGCIGTIQPSEATLAEEIVSNAISACSRDPRFMPVDASELDGLEYSVDVLSAPEPIPDLEGHDPKRLGLIVEAHGRRGLLLPDLETIDTAGQQEEVCRAKGGIGPDEPVKLWRFTVERYH